MNDTIIYRPYRTYAWFLPFTIIGGTFLFVLAGIIMPSNIDTAIFLMIFGALTVCITKHCYDAARLAILFNREGLQIIGNHSKCDYFYPWAKYSYAYYSKNYRGFSCLVLSSKTLDPQEIKRLVRKSVNPLNVYIDDAVVMYFDHLQNNSHLKEFINSCVSHVDTY